METDQRLAVALYADPNSGHLNSLRKRQARLLGGIKAAELSWPKQEEVLEATSSIKPVKSSTQVCGQARRAR